MAQVRVGGKVRGRMTGTIARAGRVVLSLAVLAASGCTATNGVLQNITTPFTGGATTGSQNGDPGFVKGFLGAVVADEPIAALAGREVLSAGGTAADAAVAVGFALAVSLPSRAGLGGGGACLVDDPRRDGPNKGVPEAVLFLPTAPANPGAADRPAAVPMLARGLYLLHSRYGNRRFESLIGPALAMARDGIPVSRTLARDLSVVAGPLSADPGARAVFFRNGAPLSEGQRFIQPGLAATLVQMQRAGVGDLYQGYLAHILVDEAQMAGAGLTVGDLYGALGRFAPPLDATDGAATVAFLPPPADGGLAAAAAFAALRQDPNAVAAAGVRGLAAAARWRQGGVSPQAVLASAATLPPANLPALPASASFGAMDRKGNAVVCAVTMNNLFGTGRVAPGTGILLAASPATIPPPLLTAALAYAPRRQAFRALVGASGQEGAPLGAAVAMRNALAGRNPMPAPVPAPGRANVIACAGLLPGDPASCGWAVDPRGDGLAVGQPAGSAPAGASEAPSNPQNWNYPPAPGVPTYR